MSQMSYHNKHSNIIALLTCHCLIMDLTYPVKYKPQCVGLIGEELVPQKFICEKPNEVII